jgi:hypothetical protein
VTDAEQVLEEAAGLVYERHAGEWRALDHERKAIEDEGRRELAAVWDRIADREKVFQEKARPLLEAMTAELSEEAPGADDFDWPVPAEGQGHPDPLFDSKRPYVEQVERYHHHQGKTIETQYRADQEVTRNCAHCGTEFTTAGISTPKTYCGRECELAARRSRREIRTYNPACIVCGTTFTAKRSSAKVCGGTCQARLRVRRQKDDAQQAKLDGSTS